MLLLHTSVYEIIVPPLHYVNADFKQHNREVQSKKVNPP